MRKLTQVFVMSPISKCDACEYLNYLLNSLRVCLHIRRLQGLSFSSCPALLALWCSRYIQSHSFLSLLFCMSLFVYQVFSFQVVPTSLIFVLYSIPPFEIRVPDISTFCALSPYWCLLCLSFLLPSYCWSDLAISLQASFLDIFLQSL